MALIVAGERSGVGKTTITLALLAYLRQRSDRVQSFKVGPDYIDPMFHYYVTGRACRNLDPVLTSEAYVQQCFIRHTQDAEYALVEGVMGLFDGATGANDFASTAHIARLLDLPVLLVLDCSRLSRSVAAIAHGYCTFDPQLKFAGVVLNRVGSDRHLELLKAALEPLNLAILGVLRREDAIAIPDRHLGLIPTDELPALTEVIERLAGLAETAFDWKKLRPALEVQKNGDVEPNLDFSKQNLMLTEQTFEFREQSLNPKGQNFEFKDSISKLKEQNLNLEGQTSEFKEQTSEFKEQTSEFKEQTFEFKEQTFEFKGQAFKPQGQTIEPQSQTSAMEGPSAAREKSGVASSTPSVRLAVARDRAFSFYYADNLDLLEALGAELVFWSPLTDAALPEEVHGLYFGGGFPEVFAEALAANSAAQTAVRAAIEAGMPTYAECGGLMYLGQHITDFAGSSWPMVGILPTATQMDARLTLGYRRAIALQESPLLPMKSEVWGHEFHRSRLTVAPTQPLYQLRGYDPESAVSVEGWRSHQVHASYLHLHWGAQPELPIRFLQACRSTMLQLPKQES